MKTIYLNGGKASNTAIKVMTHHLTHLGHEIVRMGDDPHRYDVGLSWGRSYNGPKPFLNSKVNQFDKFNCFEAFEEYDVPCPFTYGIDYISNHVIPVGEIWLARKTHHSKGKDIAVCKTTEEARRIMRAGQHAFFSVYIPIDTEYRVWVFQDKAFATYEKVYTGQGEYKGFMRNRRFGFEFSKRDNLVGTATIEGPCIKAVKALGMDWGAVDILKGKDGKFYVLEVNSMPHISNTKRSCGVRLAKQVSMWAEKQ